METQIFFKSVKNLLQSENCGFVYEEDIRVEQLRGSSTASFSLHKAFLQTRELKPQKKSDFLTKTNKQTSKQKLFNS